MVHPADIQDRDGVYAVLALATTQTTRGQQLWADAADRGAFVRWVTVAWGWTIAIGQRAPDVGGFAVPPRRWVMDRTGGWLGRCRRLSKDEEAYPVTSETWIALALGALFLRRLCPSSQMSYTL